MFEFTSGVFMGLIAAAMLFGMAIGDLLVTRSMFVRQYTERPFCDTATVGDRTYKRCWIAKEVEPAAEAK